MATLLTSAAKLKAEQKFNKAKDKYEQVLDIAPTSVPALRALADLAFEQEDWGDVKKWNKRILETEPADLRASYQLGIAYRETGKYKAAFLKSSDFNNSRKYFDAVVGRDSTFQDVLLQRAQLERLDENWREAIYWGHRQVAFKSELPSAHTILYGFYRLFLIHKNNDDAMAWLANQEHDWTEFAVGELYRRREQYARADSVLQNMVGRNLTLSKIPILQSLVRLHVAQDHSEIANRLYWNAVDSAQSEIDFAFLFEDSKYLFTGEELRHFRALTNADEKRRFFRQFWLKRELVPAAAITFRLIEHYRRLLVAEKDYWFDGVRSFVNNPDRLSYLDFPEVYHLNHEFNDKGLIYIRHGEPDDIARTLGESLTSNESWLYYEREDRPKLIFHFLISEFGAGNNWRLAASLENRAILADRLGWDHAITRVYQSGSFGELQSALIRMSEQSKETVSYAMTNDFHTWKKSVQALAVSYHIASFKAPRNKTRLDIYWSLATAQLEFDENGSASLDFGGSVLDSAFNQKGLVRKQAQIARGASPEDARFVRHYSFELAPGDYNVAFYVKQQTDDRTYLGGENLDWGLPSIDSHELTVSDLVPADKIAQPPLPGAVNKDGLAIIPNPSKAFELNKPVYLYYEIYNLAQDENGETDFEIENEIVLEKKKKGGLGKIFGFLGGDGKKKVSITERRQGREQDVAEYMSFNISSLEEGEYRLAVKVTDKVASKTTEKSLSLTLAEEIR